MKTDELREKYLAFFESKGCSRQGSDVLVPTWDPSVLFTPAGMNPFKDHFLGKVKLDFTRATTCQKCLRTGDIDNVGRTAYHHTFFEMLGNFSFGDYFKREAIAWAWEFLTDKKWLGIEKDRLTVTVYKDDEEAFGIWNQEIGLPTARIARMEEDENFWPASAPSLGPDGVCGPCSEIYYQLENGASVEIWNLVFTQFNRVGDPPDNLRPLPSKNIDTGMGLERTASVLQGVPTNFHIDSLLPIVQAAAEVVGVPYEYESDNGRRLRRITDHVRASTFAVHENVYPGANGAKYVIRRLIRRAVLDGHQMGLRDPFLFQLVGAVGDAMASQYPELKETSERVQGVIRREEETFFGTIDAGLDRIHRMFDAMESENRGLVDGGQAADLYQTYGVPPELLQTLAAEQNYTFDWAGYQEAMAQHADISNTGQRVLFQTGPLETLKEALRETQFLGYEQTTAEVTIKGIITGDGSGKEDDGQLLSHVTSHTDEPLRVVLDQSPFYGESGGQVGDHGRIFNDDFEFEVTDTQKHAGLLVHLGYLKRGEMRESATATAAVDETRRAAIARAHSATHVLHYVLQKNIGQHAQQQGSKVDADWLRFDFTNQESLDEAALVKIESDVNERVAAAAPIEWKTLPLAEARQAGAMMLFGEKYPDPVRMVSMGDFSRELCGGTHLSSTDAIEAFTVVAEESVSAGTRRVVALTGQRAAEHRRETQQILQQVLATFGCTIDKALDRTVKLMDEVRTLKKDLSSGRASKLEPMKITPAAAAPTDQLDYADVRATVRDIARHLNVAAQEVPQRLETLIADRDRLLDEIQQASEGEQISAAQLLEQAETVGDAILIVRETAGANPNQMRGWIDQVRKQSEQPAAVLLASVQGEKVLLVGGLSKALVERGLKAGQWVGDAAKMVGGGGGGRPDLAQAGGRDPEKLQAALEAAQATMRQSLA
ncbi:alanine--tRNA ligase [Roseimaritima ulvae]|uniref:Alanine--tRNA ligase n=1 Tax=Roseimaritima ulvae TaxID=980254 RepID=A0A5B9QTM7_9BACT|nr:alanine--tRNA ligase [Roseimaritima ulvae]QEG42407.1 Alanine--tRNA ligase [Roseimaritima ulvae]